MRPLQVLTVRVDLGVITMKGYSTFAIAPGLEPQVSLVSRILADGYPSTEVQFAYSTAPAK